MKKIAKYKKNIFNKIIGISRKRDFKKNLQLLVLSLPVMIYVFIFHYLPIGGIVLAFKNYRYDLGVLGSPWVGLKNFEFFFTSDIALRVTFNTVAYNSAFIVFGLIINIIVALLLNEIRNKLAIKFYQTTMFFPTFLSWVVVAFVAYTFMSPGYGMLNRMIEAAGGETRNWFLTPEIWPFVLFFANVWKSMGYGVLINYSVLVGIDKTYYEAASIDGATRFQMAYKISLPFLIPVTIIQFILSVGKIFNADFGLFYQVPQNSPLLYKVTDVIETFVFRALMENAQIGMGAAVGLYKSFVGLILVLITNTIVKKVRKDSALF